MTELIWCRANVAPDCYDGRPAKGLYPDDDPAEDGTYDRHGTVVCDACYVLLMPLTPSGQGLNSELPAAIERFRRSGDD